MILKSAQVKMSMTIINILFPFLKGGKQEKRGFFYPFFSACISLISFFLLNLFSPLLYSKVSYALPIKENILQHALKERESATATLQEFCKTPIVAYSLPTEKNIIPPYILQALKILNPLDVQIRHVQLLCGEDVFSEAWNYYIPARLPLKTQEILSKTHIPFGRAVGEAHFYRQSLPPVKNSQDSLKSGFIFQNQAILFKRTTRLPLAFVIENYTQKALKAATNLNAAPHQEQ